MGTNNFELGDKVRINNNADCYRGISGMVTSLLIDKEHHNIGVNLDGDHFDPTPYYFDSTELDKIS